MTDLPDHYAGLMLLTAQDGGHVLLHPSGLWCTLPTDADPESVALQIRRAVRAGVRGPLHLDLPTPTPTEEPA